MFRNEAPPVAIKAATCWPVAAVVCALAGAWRWSFFDAETVGALAGGAPRCDCTGVEGTNAPAASTDAKTMAALARIERPLPRFVFSMACTVRPSPTAWRDRTGIYASKVGCRMGSVGSDTSPVTGMRAMIESRMGQSGWRFCRSSVLPALSIRRKKPAVTLTLNPGIGHALPSANLKATASARESTGIKRGWWARAGLREVATGRLGSTGCVARGKFLSALLNPLAQPVTASFAARVQTLSVPAKCRLSQRCARLAVRQVRAPYSSRRRPVIGGGLRVPGVCFALRFVQYSARPLRVASMPTQAQKKKAPGFPRAFS